MKIRVFVRLWRCSLCGSRPHHLHMQITQGRPSVSNIMKYLKSEAVSDVSHCSSGSQPAFCLIMFAHFNLAILTVLLILHDQGKITDRLYYVIHEEICFASVQQ